MTSPESPSPFARLATDRPAAAAPRPRPPREHPWLFALALGALVLAAGLGTQMVEWESHFARDRFLHVSLVASLVVAAARAPVEAAARRLLGARGPVVAWRALGCAALALAGAMTYTLGTFVNGGWSFFDWFGRLWELEPEAGVVPAAATVAAFVLARLPVAPRRRLRAESPLALALAAALLGAAAARSARAPEPHRYVSTLRVLGVVPASGVAVGWNASRAGEPTARFDDHALGDVTLRRYAFEHRGRCGLRLARDRASLPPSVTYEQVRETSCDRLVLRDDRAHGLYVVEETGRWGATHRPFDAATLAPLPEYRSGAMGRVRGAFALPRSWLVASALLLAVALAARLAPSRGRRALAAHGAWRAGTLRDDGMIVFSDGAAPVPCPYGSGLAPGPVVLLAGGRAGGDGAPFRGSAVAPTPERDDLRAGTVAEVAAALEAEGDARLAYATTVALLAAAPWAAAAVEGLVP